MSSKQSAREFLGRDLGPEALLLLLCARTAMSDDLAAQISKLAQAPRLDWDALADMADKHRVTQLLFRNLSAICPEAMPTATRVRLRHQFFTNAGFNLKLADALLSLLEVFDAEGIPVLPFKGGVLAHCTYGKLAWRQYYDIDLLVDHGDRARSEALLKSQGFVCDETFDRELRFRRVDDDVEVDLHWAFAPRYFYHSVEFGELFERAQVVDFQGHEIRTLSPEDFLLVLCLQVVKDSWERRQQLEHVSKVCDIAEHVRAHPDLDWTRVMREARGAGLRRTVLCALRLSRELLATELPPRVLKAVESDDRALKAAKNMCRSLFTDDDTLSPLDNPYLSLSLRMRQLRFYLGVRERYRDRIRHIAEILRPGRP